MWQTFMDQSSIKIDTLGTFSKKGTNNKISKKIKFFNTNLYIFNFQLCIFHTKLIISILTFPGWNSADSRWNNLSEKVSLGLCLNFKSSVKIDSQHKELFPYFHTKKDSRFYKTGKKWDIISHFNGCW